MIFIDNKYSKYYYNIILKAKSRCIQRKKDAKSFLGYVERHHIIPRSLGGSNDPCNLVFLTAKEHFVCHLLLPRMTFGKFKSKMWHALWCIINQNSKVQHRYKVSARVYEKIKEKNSKSLSVDRLGKSNLYAKGKSKTKEHREKLRIANSGKNNPNFGKKRKDHSKKMLGRGNSMFGKLGTDNPLFGKTRDPVICKKIKENRWDEVRKQKQSELMKEKRKSDPILQCTHCEKQGKGGVMYRYHFSRCKNKILTTPSVTI